MKILVSTKPMQILKIELHTNTDTDLLILISKSMLMSILYILPKPILIDTDFTLFSEMSVQNFTATHFKLKMEVCLSQLSVC